MSNATKIKTMKDDLLEIEGKVSQSIKAPEKQQQSATLSKTPSSAISGQNPGNGFSLSKVATISDDLKTKELRNIVSRLSNKNSENTTDSSAKITLPSSNPEIKTSASGTNELKDLISRISKREGGDEKPLTTPVEKNNAIVPETKPAEKTAIISPASKTEKLPELKPIKKPDITAIKKEVPKESPATIKQEQNKPIKLSENLPESKTSDIDKLIKRFSVPAVKPIEKKPEIATKTAADVEVAPKNVLQKEPIVPVKDVADKKVFNNITEKKEELKDILEKMSKKKDIAAAVPVLETKVAQQNIVTPKDIEKKAISSAEKLNLKKFVSPAEKPFVKLPETKIISASLPKPKEIPIKKEQAKNDRPIMKKLRERLFGIEKEILSAKPETKNTPAPVIKKEIEPAAIKPAEAKQAIQKEEKIATPPEKIKVTDYFKKISNENAVSAPKIEKIEEKFANLPKNKQVSEMKPDKISEFENASGIIKSAPEINTKKEEELAKARRSYIDSQYVSPTNRLVFGKQEHYSSIRKRIEERHLDANLKDLESKVAVSKNIILSEKEEKKKLKERIISKYHIKSSPLLRNILIVAVIVIAIGGVALYNYLSSIKPEKPPEIVVPIITGSELKELSKITDFTETTIEKLKNPTVLRDEASTKFSSDPNLKFYKMVIKDSSGNMVVLKDALEGIGMNTQSFPQTFIESSENEYDIIVFKTLRSTARLGLAIKLKDSESMRSAMSSWENDRPKMKESLDPLFISDRSSDITNSFFQTGAYKGVSLRYVSLPDKDTAIDYFIYNNILVIATSKDDTFNLIDLLTAGN